VDDRSREFPGAGRVSRVEVTEALAWRGGVAEAAVLKHLTSRRRIRSALGRGEIVRLGRGRYALPDAEKARAAAARVSGVVSHLSAAQLNGWEVKRRPALPMVTVPRGRKVGPQRRRGIDLRWRLLDADDVWNGQTRAGRTVTDCSRDLPFDEALTVADSAVRHGSVTRAQLVRLAELVATTGRAQCLRVAEHASGLSANPFESVLRAVSLDVPGLDLQPQVVIEQDGFVGRPDLVDVRRRLVVEAESFEFHGHRAALRHDCERYNALALRGWLVLRFAWEQVFYDPEYVRQSLEVARFWRPRRRTPLRPPAARSA
jgi:very-short-patch-repair endonuclease